MKAKYKATILVLVLVILILLSWGKIKDALDDLDGAAVTGMVVAPPVERTVDIEAYFCQVDDCEGELLAWLDAAEEYIYCAFYELELPAVKAKLAERSRDVTVALVTDDDYFDQVSDLSFARNDGRSGLMHNKFCVIDGTAVWTGSFNPTDRGQNSNDNNALFIQSKNIGATYDLEFREMWNGVYGKGDVSPQNDFVLNGNNVSVYFCPEDWCANKVEYALQDARDSIDFMTFSFTHDGIGQQVLDAASRGVEVRGVFEKSQNNAYTEFKKFSDAGLDVRWDGNPANMHHKVFVIDKEVVITGSFNPTANADKNNDENLLVIHDKELAAQYLEEFERVWGETSD